MNVSFSSSSPPSPEAIKLDMRKFIYRVGYLTDSYNYYGKAALKIKIRDDGKAISDMLNDEEDYHYYKLRSLNERVQLLNGSDAELKEVWILFYKAVIDKTEPRATKRLFDKIKKEFFPASPRLMAFGDLENPKKCGTDLEIYSDDAGDVPNGIRESEIEAFNQQYLEFASLLTFDTAPVLLNPRDPTSFTSVDRGNFVNQVLQDVRILMSRPLGRELIQRILDRHKQNHIRIQIRAASSGCKYRELGFHRHQIDYAIHPAPFLQRMPGVGLVSLATPPFIRFGHELIHLLHYLDGEARHLADPKIDPRNTNSEEWRTIDGKCRCPNHQSPPVDIRLRNTLDEEGNLSIHPIHENSLRDAFDLPQRETHFYGSSKHASDREKLVHAFRAGADADVMNVIQANRLSSPDLDHVVSKLADPSVSSQLPQDMIPRVLNAAINDRTLRRGRILGGIRSPTGSIPRSPSRPLSPVLSSTSLRPPIQSTLSTSQTNRRLAPPQAPVSASPLKKQRITSDPASLPQFPSHPNLAPPAVSLGYDMPSLRQFDPVLTSQQAPFPSLSIAPSGPSVNTSVCTCPHIHHVPSQPSLHSQGTPGSISSLFLLPGPDDSPQSPRTPSYFSNPFMAFPVQSGTSPYSPSIPLSQLRLLGGSSVQPPQPRTTSSNAQSAPHSHLRTLGGPSLQLPQPSMNTTSHSQSAPHSHLRILGGPPPQPSMMNTRSHAHSAPHPHLRILSGPSIQPPQPSTNTSSHSQSAPHTHLRILGGSSAPHQVAHPSPLAAPQERTFDDDPVLSYLQSMQDDIDTLWQSHPAPHPHQSFLGNSSWAQPQTTQARMNTSLQLRSQEMQIDDPLLDLPQPTLAPPPSHSHQRSFGGPSQSHIQRGMQVYSSPHPQYSGQSSVNPSTDHHLRQRTHSSWQSFIDSPIPAVRQTTSSHAGPHVSPLPATSDTPPAVDTYDDIERLYAPLRNAYNGTLPKLHDATAEGRSLRPRKRKAVEK